MENSTILEKVKLAIPFPVAITDIHEEDFAVEFSWMGHRFRVDYTLRVEEWTTRFMNSPTALLLQFLLEAQGKLS